MLPIVDIFADGSFDKKYKKSGYAGLLSCDIHKCMIFGSEEESTNNRGELLGLLQSIAQLNTPCEVNFYSDSEYVVNAIRKGWIWNWEKQDWIRNKKDMRPNYDLWISLIPYLHIHKVQAYWVRGHNGHVENELCDAIAKSQAFSVVEKTHS